MKHMICLDASADEEAAEWDDGEAESLGQILVCKGVGVIILGEDIQEAAIDRWAGVVELVNITMFERVDDHF